MNARIAGELGPLSITNCPGSPNVAKVFLIFLMVTSEVDDINLSCEPPST